MLVEFYVITESHCLTLTILPKRKLFVFSDNYMISSPNPAFTTNHVPANPHPVHTCARSKRSQRLTTDYYLSALSKVNITGFSINI